MSQTPGEGVLRCLEGWRKRGTGAGVLPDCALVIATYERPKEIVALLENLTKLPDPPGQVVVVDGSPDEIPGGAILAWSKSGPFPFELVYVKSPAGLTRQRNVGVDASTGDFVFFLDDDCLPEPGYFRAIRDVFRQDTSSEVGAVCGSIVNELGATMSLRWRVRLLLRLVTPGESGNYYPTGTSIPRRTVTPFAGTRPVEVMPGGATAYRRSVLERHRFSLFFDGYSQGEDLEMSLRVGQEHRLLWCGDAHVNHYHAAAGRPASFQKGMMEVRNRFFISKRYRVKPFIAHRVRFWLDIAYILAIDLVMFFLRPAKFRRAEHAAGIVAGSIHCFLRPPRYEEPRARREYEFSLSPVPDN